MEYFCLNPVSHFLFPFPFFYRQFPRGKKREHYDVREYAFNYAILLWMGWEVLFSIPDDMLKFYLPFLICSWKYASKENMTQLKIVWRRQSSLPYSLARTFSISSLLRIFPEADFGTVFMNDTLLNFLKGATCKQSRQFSTSGWRKKILDTPSRLHLEWKRRENINKIRTFLMQNHSIPSNENLSEEDWKVHRLRPVLEYLRIR